MIKRLKLNIRSFKIGCLGNLIAHYCYYYPMNFHYLKPRVNRELSDCQGNRAGFGLHLSSICRSICRLPSGPYESICDEPTLKEDIKTCKPHINNFFICSSVKYYYLYL